MQEKKSTKPNKLEDFTNLKSLMSLNESLFEATKTAIRTKNHEIALKMIENLSDRPDLWVEYLSLAILWQNFPIFKHMIEKFNMDPHQIVNINAALFNCEYFSDPTNKSQKPAENKENYLQVECPLIIIAAVGGDIDIYKFLVDRGVNQNVLGYIGLSKKSKNSVISNLIGACAFYGRIDLLHYLLEKSQIKLDINQKSTEKKSKTKQFSLHKDFAEFTPVHLSFSNDLNSEDDSIEIIKLLQRYKGDLTALDWNRNNILHLAVKFNKKRIVKFILEDLKYLEMLEVSNKEGQTPMAIAKSFDNPDIFNYLQTFCKSNQVVKDLEEDLLELIEDTSSKKKKNKKNKKKKEDNLGVIGTTNDFQESLKLPKPIEIVSKPEEKPAVENVKVEKQKEKEVDKLQEDYSGEEVEGNEETNQGSKQYYERKSYYTNYGDNKIKKNYNYAYNKSSNTTNNYSSNPTYSNRNYEKDYNDYDYSYKTYKKDSYYNNYNNTNTYADDKKYGKFTQSNKYKSQNYESYSNTTAVPSNPIQPQALITADSLNKNPPRSVGIVGLSTKNEKKYQAKTVEKERETSTKELEKNAIETVVSSENKIVSEVVEIFEKVPDGIVSQTVHEFESAQYEKKEIEVSDTLIEKYQVKKIDEQDLENEEDFGEENFITDENLEDKDLEEEATNKANEINEINETPQDKYFNENIKAKFEEIDSIEIKASEPINEHEEKVEKLEIKDEETLRKKEICLAFSETTEKELKELTAKYFDLEKQLETEKRANEDLRLFNKSHIKPVKIDIHQYQVVNSEEKISDIILLANEELSRQSKKISELTSRLEYFEGKEIRSLDEIQLNSLKDFYSTRLGLVIDSLNNLKNH